MIFARCERASAACFSYRWGGTHCGSALVSAEWSRVPAASSGRSWETLEGSALGRLVHRGGRRGAGVDSEKSFGAEAAFGVETIGVEAIVP